MITVRAGNGAIWICLLLISGCSREQQDWRSAEAADTIDSYGRFIQQHPESELTTQARMRVAQLGEDRDWQHAGSADTVDAYREFLAQHPNGKWAQEARIRIENFSLGEQAGTDAGSRAAARIANGGASAGGGSRATGGPSGTADSSPVGTGTAPSGPVSSGGGRLAVPGEAAVAGAGAGGPASASGAPPGGAPAAGSATGGNGGPTPTTRVALSEPPQAGFGIQLGAFSSEASASNQWRALTARFATELQGLHEHVVSADTPAGRVYRLQASVGDEQHARAVCEALRKQSQGCVAVLPH